MKFICTQPVIAKSSHCLTLQLLHLLLHLLFLLLFLLLLRLFFLLLLLLVPAPFCFPLQWIPGFGTPVPSVHSRRSTQLLSPANLRMLSPAKSARRTGGWKFWDDSASRRSSPSISSAGRSVSGDRASSPMFWGSAMTPSPGNPSPLRMEVSDGTGNSFKIPSDGDGGSGSGSARSVRSGSKRVSFELPSVEENSFGISIPMEDTEDFDNQESPTKIGRSENGSPLAQTIDPNEISTPMKTCTSKEVDLIDGHEAIMRSPSGEGKEALSAPSDGKE